MTVKLSSTKITRLLRMYFQGFTQLSIALKLKITQAAVSLYVQEFSMVVEENGLEVAAKEYDVVDIVKEMHSLGAELKKSGLTVEEAKKGLKAAIAFEECGISQEEYNAVVATCIKVQQDGFLQAAVKLHYLEESTGLSSQQIVAQAEASHNQLMKEKGDLSSTKAEISQAKQALGLVQQQIQKADMDAKRLEKVETLAAALKDGGVTDKELDGYIQRQSLLNKSGVSISTFGQILDAAQLAIVPDAGKRFLKKLTEYSGLETTVTALKQEKQSLEYLTKDLEEKAKIKGTLQTEITTLHKQKGELEGAINAKQAEYTQVYHAVNALKSEKKSLSDDVSNLKNTVIKKQTAIAESQTLSQQLTQEIETKQQKVSDLHEIETKRDSLLLELSDINTKVSDRKMQWNIFTAFVGILQNRSEAELLEFLKMETAMVNMAKKDKQSADFVIGHMFNLLGPELRIMKCGSCGIRCTVDRPVSASGFRCPSGEFGHMMHEDKSAMEVLANLIKPKAVTFVKMITPELKKLQ
jgi:predicted transcriptional regulator